jgi:hypothetical protein
MWLAIGGMTASHLSNIIHTWEELSYVVRVPKYGKASHMLEDVPCVGMLTTCRKASHISAVLKSMFMFKPQYTLLLLLNYRRMQTLSQLLYIMPDRVLKGVNHVHVLGHRFMFGVTFLYNVREDFPYKGSLPHV